MSGNTTAWTLRRKIWASVCLLSCSLWNNGAIEDRSDSCGWLYLGGEDACGCKWTPRSSGRLRVCFYFVSRPRVSCRFLLLRSAASLTTRSLCAGGVSKQGRAPDMVEGKILLPVLCFRLFCSEVTGPRSVDLLPSSQTFPSKLNIWFLSSEIVCSISRNERPMLWFTSSLWQKCCHLHSVISQPSVSVPEVEHSSFDGAFRVHWCCWSSAPLLYSQFAPPRLLSSPPLLVSHSSHVISEQRGGDTRRHLAKWDVGDSF